MNNLEKKEIKLLNRDITLKKSIKTCNGYSGSNFLSMRNKKYYGRMSVAKIVDTEELKNVATAQLILESE